MPEKRVNQYPHRIFWWNETTCRYRDCFGCNPKLLIADEPTTALDVTIQAQILELMKELQKKMDTSIIFITHDLGVVANVADRVAVMYAGQIVETGTVDEIFYNPRHPYTWGLLASMPSLDNDDEGVIAIPGTPPDLIKSSKRRCICCTKSVCIAIDFEKATTMFQISDTHYAATWFLIRMHQKWNHRSL